MGGWVEAVRKSSTKPQINPPIVNVFFFIIVIFEVNISKVF